MGMLVGGNYQQGGSGGSSDAVALYDVLAGGLGTTGITGGGGVVGWSVVMIYNNDSSPVGRNAQQWVDDDDNAGEYEVGEVLDPPANIVNYYIRYIIVTGDDLLNESHTENTWYSLATDFILTTDSGANAARSGQMRIEISDDQSTPIDTCLIDWVCDGFK